MISGSSPLQLTPEQLRRQDYTLSDYAPRATRIVGVVGQPLLVEFPQHRNLEEAVGYSINTARQYPAHATTMPPKRSAADDGNGGPSKQIKTEHPEEFSNAVKKKLQSSSRTGQACDRCKIRKIRCDGLPGGCSPCLQNQTECKTTDRITGRAAPRGYVEGLEAQNRTMEQRIRELEHQLIRGGADIKPSNCYHNASSTSYGYSQPSTTSPAPAWSSNSATYTPQSSNAALTAQQPETNMFRSTPASFRAGLNGDNYLGVNPGNSNLSSIKGTALSILGMEIDIADFDSLDMDEPDPTVFHAQLYNKSYQSFLQSALNINPRMEKVDLPSREDGMTYAQWYFRVLNPYLPLLHRPSFFKLLTRMYDDPTFRPTPAETVIVHMVFAIMFFQYAVRNWEDSAQQTNLNNLSNMHYHHSLSLFYQLSCSHTVQDVQALTLICAHLRNFPKPGASWMLCQTTISLAIELGLHRSSKKWASEVTPNPLDVEMRKRIWWSLLAITVTLSGKLGRPIIRYEDFDVEIPEPVDDELLSENGLDTSRPGRCLHNIGLLAYRILPLFMEMYSSIYAVRRDPEEYVATVNRMEAKLQAWKNSLPEDLVKGEAGENEQEGRVFSLYAQGWALEFRLLLRHPSVSATADANFNAESMRICVESSRQMLGVVRQLQKFKSLDTTWYQSAVYVMAITTTLFAQWDKRGEISAADLAALREEMNIWLEIMGDVGALLGSGTRLREAVRVVTDGTLGLLSRGLPATKTPQYSSIEDTKPARAAPAQNMRPSFSSPPQNYPRGPTPPPYVSDAQIHQQTPYPAATQYSTYPESIPSQNVTYTPQTTYPTYPPSSSNENIDAPLLAAFAAGASQLPSNHSPHSYNQHGQTPQPSSAWQQYTMTMTNNLEPHDWGSASALMQLQGGREMNGDGAQGPELAVTSGIDGGHLGGQVSGGMGMTWPLNIFDIGQSS